MDLGYINARVRGMHSRLLGPKAFDALMIQQDIPSLVSELEKTPYRDEIQEASVLYPGLKGIETALRLNLVHTCQKILSLVEGSDAEQLVRIILARWDVHNIKTVMRGKHLHVSPEEIEECLIPAGSLGEPLLVELIKQPDVRGVVDLLATWDVPFARPLTQYFDEYASARELSILEYALDRFYYENSLALLKAGKSDHEVMRTLLMQEIDSLNLKNAIRMNRDRVDPETAEKYFLPGGEHITSEKFLALVKAGTIDEIVGNVEGTPYYFLAPLIPEAMRTGTFSVLEKELDEYLTRKGTGVFRSDPLGGAVVIGYLWAKQNEIINIRIIARCKDARIPDAELEKELRHV
ncbi:MAG TPA: V-type ATPase subunit [Methanolinea sp.]|jgi:V/A-type H+-transporting ATPase subunit C|nr:V-type ATPase subunit [Methanolinea sp.]HPC54883.1 V-type ATPase subunit [Methanolinea sp.]HRS92373.1 V-type ATPase subunit [Methanolinea sp.]HRU79179.1 V-type ATPase subunit [Methanolinea sp.]